MFTHHAMRRWLERFPDRDPDLAYANARRVGKRTMRKIMAAQNTSRHRPEEGRYLIKFNDIVFVMRTGEVIVTVLQYPPPKERAA